MTGYCKFCGQSFMTQADSEEVANYNATMNCKCDKAMSFKYVEGLKESARNNVDALFQDQPEELKELMFEAIEHIADRRIASVQIKISTRITGTVARGKEGIIVKRKYTEENTLEG